MSQPVAAILVAAGTSRRFGTDKLWIDIWGRPGLALGTRRAAGRAEHGHGGAGGPGRRRRSLHRGVAARYRRASPRRWRRRGADRLGGGRHRGPDRRGRDRRNSRPRPRRRAARGLARAHGARRFRGPRRNGGRSADPGPRFAEDGRCRARRDRCGRPRDRLCRPDPPGRDAAPAARRNGGDARLGTTRHRRGGGHGFRRDRRDGRSMASQSTASSPIRGTTPCCAPRWAAGAFRCPPPR